MATKKTAEELSENIYEQAVGTIEGWISKNCVESDDLKNAIEKKLDNSMDDIIHAMLGFEKDGWGRHKWKVDHCNGRSGESAVGDYLKSKVGGAVNEWLDKAAVNFRTMKLNKEAAASLKREAQRSFEREIKRQVRCMAQNAASKFVADVVNNVKLDEKKMSEATNAIKFMAVFGKYAYPEDKKK